MPKGPFYQFRDARIRRESAKAYLCQIGYGEFWIPKSQIEKLDREWGDILTTEWWADVSGAMDAFEGYQRESSPPPPSGDLSAAEKIFRRLALKYHPDHHPETAEVMKDINELWQAIKKAKK